MNNDENGWEREIYQQGGVVTAYAKKCVEHEVNIEKYHYWTLKNKERLLKKQKL